MFFYGLLGNYEHLRKELQVSTADSGYLLVQSYDVTGQVAVGLF